MKTHITLFTLALLAAFIPAVPSSADCDARGESVVFELRTVTIDGVETQGFEAGNLLTVEGDYAGATAYFSTDGIEHGALPFDKAGGAR